MDSDRGVELGLRGITFERDRHALDYFARIGTHHVASDDAVGLGIDDNAPMRIQFGPGVVSMPEGTNVPD